MGQSISERDTACAKAEAVLGEGEAGMAEPKYQRAEGAM